MQGVYVCMLPFKCDTLVLCILSLCTTVSWLSAQVADIFLQFTYFSLYKGNTCYRMQGDDIFLPKIIPKHIYYNERNMLMAEYSETEQ